MADADHRKPKARVLIADDEAVVSAAISKLIELECEVVGIVEDGRMLLIEAEKLRPNLIIMEITLPSLNGLDAARHLTKVIPGCKIIFLTAQNGATHIAEAFKAGASAYVLKRSSPSELSQAIQTVLKGQCYLTSLVTRDVVTNRAHGSKRDTGTLTVAALTPRQREVLQLIAEGRGTKEVATLLNIAVKTVEFHKIRIMNHLNLHSTAALIKHAIAEGLVRP